MRYWLISERRRTAEGRGKKELLVTTIPPDTWKDLWRIEIETRDEPGTLAHIHRVLEMLHLRTFVAEGNSNILDASHTMTFIVSAVDYKTAADKGTEHRFRNPRSALREAELTLKANLLDKLSLGMVNEPRLKLRPLSAFKSLHMDCHVRDLRRILDERGHIYNGSVRLPDAYLVAGQGGEKQKTYYTVVVDTKLRMVRLAFFDEGEAYGHIRLSFESDQSDKVLARIFGLLADNGGNVLRFQLRAAKDEKPNAPPDVEIEHRVCLDISFVSNWRHQPNADLQARAVELIGRDKELAASDLRFERSYADFGYEKEADIQPG